MGILMQVICTAFICCLCLSVGIMFAWPSTTLRLFESTNTTLHRPMTETELALLGSLSSVGSLVGIPAAGILLDKVGRKQCNIIGALLNVLCWVIISISNRVEAVLISVFVSGLGGSVFIAVPIYISEICQESIRGAMTSGSTVFYGLGMLLSYLLAGYLEYFTMNYVSLSLAVMGLVMVMFLKESPVYLMTKGLEKDAARSIAFYRGIKSDDKEVLEEINTIRRSLDPNMDTPEVVTPEEEKLNPITKPAQKLSIWQFIRKSRSTRQAMFVSLVLITASMLQGLVVVQVYAEPLFAEAIPTMSPILCSVLLAVVGVVAGFVAAYLMELAGRRALMIHSSILSGICCILLGTQIHLTWGPSWITPVVIYIFTVVYTVGAGTVPFVLPTEVFLPEVKSFASMLVMEWMCVCSSIILFIFNPLVNAIGLGPLFYVFSVFCFLTAVFCQFFLPETKGKSVEEIQLAFSKKKRHPPVYACFVWIWGVIFAWPSSTLRLFESANTTLHRPMSETELALFGSLSSIGALISTPIAGIYLDKLGRKRCSVVSAFTCVLSWIMIASSNRVEVLLTALFVSGLSCSVFLIVPVYISEICQESIRGAMTSGAMVFYGIGMLISYILGSCLEYNIMIYICLSLSVVGTLCIYVLKESPVFLMKNGMEDDAAKSIAFYRGTKPDSKEVIEELGVIRRALHPDLDTPDVNIEEEKLKPVEKSAEKKLSKWQFIKRSHSTRQALVVTLVLVSASIFQGLVVVQVYAEPLFEEAIPSMSATVCSVILAVTTVLSGLVAAYLTELAGRRPLMIYSSFASGVSCIVLGTQIHMHWGPSWLTAIIMYLFTVVYTFGAGSVPYVVIPEVFLPEVKSFVSMLVIEWAWLCNSIILFIFNPLLRAIGLGPVFYIFAVVCIMTALFCMLYMPETKGIPLDAIQSLFSKKKSVRPPYA